MRWILRVSAFFTILNMGLVTLSVEVGKNLPDGGQVVYDALVNRNVEIYTLDITHRIRLNVSRNESLDTQAVWSPDGRYVVFHSRRDGGRWLYVMDANGANAHPLTNDPYTTQYNPVWSPDSQYIYYRSHPGVNAPIFRVRMDGSGMEPFDEIAFGKMFDQGFDASHFMVMTYKNGNWGIFTYSSKWSEMRQLTNNNILFRELPQWSFDNRHIAFISLEQIKSEIYVMDADGGNFQQITDDGIRKSNLAWRP